MINEEDSKLESTRKISQWKKTVVHSQVLTVLFVLFYLFCSWKMQTASLKFMESSDASVQALQSKFPEHLKDMDRESLEKLMNEWTEGTLKANQHFSDAINDRLQIDEIWCLGIVGINLFGMICLWRGWGLKPAK